MANQPRRNPAAAVFCRRVVPLLAAAMLAAACGHRMSTDSLLAANETSSAAPSPAASPDSEQLAAGGVGETATVDVATTIPAGAAPSEAVDQGQAATGAACTTSETGPILIGSVGNYSGVAGATLLPTVRGLQLWAAWANSRGGVCGREVQIIVVDDHSDPAQHRAAVQDLVENRHIVSFSNLAPLTGSAGRSYIESARVPVIGAGIATPSEANSQMYFLTGTAQAEMIWGSARAAALYGPPSHRFGYVTCREVAGCNTEVNNAMNDAARAGVDVVYRGQASIAQPDYTSECQGASAARAEVISVFLDPASVRRFARSCERQGYRPVHTGVAFETGFATEPGFSTIILVSAVFPFTADVTPAQQEFQAAIANLYGGPAGYQEAAGWVYGKIFERAAIVAGQTTGTITSSSLIDALHTFRDETFDGLTIPITYPAGKPGIYPPCWFAVKATNGTWETLNDGAPHCR